MIEVGGLQSVDRYGVLVTFEIQCVKLDRPIQDLVRAVVWWLQRLLDRVMSHKYMGGGFQGVVNPTSWQGRLSGRCTTKDSHGAFQSGHIAGRVNTAVTSRDEKFSGETQAGAVDKFGCRAADVFF